jgi:hypothetical protein
MAEDAKGKSEIGQFISNSAGTLHFCILAGEYYYINVF